MSLLTITNLAVLWTKSNIQVFPVELSISSKPFAKIVNDKKPWAIFAKNFILDVWLGSECFSDKLGFSVFCNIFIYLNKTVPTSREKREGIYERSFI